MALLLRAAEPEQAADYIIRCCHNRTLPEGKKLWEKMQEGLVAGKVTFRLPAGRGRKAREVTREIRAARVELKKDKDSTLPVTRILAEEIGAPEGEKPVVWRRLTNKAVTTLEEAVEIIDWYRIRRESKSTS